MRSCRFFAALIAALAACGEAPAPPPLPSYKTPIPEKLRPRVSDEEREALASPRPLATNAQNTKSLALRFTTPGTIRWSLDLGSPIWEIRWTPLAGLIVSAGAEVHNVTSHGVNRFRSVAGKEHRVLAMIDAEMVWSRTYQRIIELNRRGRLGWQREWTGDVVVDELGRVYLLDASTVAALGPDGTDRWRASPDGIRSLKGPFVCGEDLLFHGTRGQSSVAVRLSGRGSVMREVALESGTALIGAGPGCEPLVWQKGKTALIDAQGQPIFERVATEAPFVARGETGFVLIYAQAERQARAEGISFTGRKIWQSLLPVSGRVTSANILLGDNLRASAIGLCLSVSSPCSRLDDHRGPFNALLLSDGADRFHAHLRHLQGHLNFVSYPTGGLVIASSSDPKTTDLTLRDANLAVVWQITLQGRLSAGPYVGPSGEIYLGTCRDWTCQGPYLLSAVTGQVPAQDTDDSELP